MVTTESLTVAVSSDPSATTPPMSHPISILVPIYTGDLLVHVLTAPLEVTSCADEIEINSSLKPRVLLDPNSLGQPIESEAKYRGHFTDTTFRVFAESDSSAEGPNDDSDSPETEIVTKMVSFDF